MWYALAASTAMNAAGGLLEYKASQKQAKAQNRWREYSNKMRMLSSAANQNILSANEQFAVEDSADRAVQIMKNELRAKGAAQVAQGTAGITGLSAADVIVDVSRNAAVAEQKRRTSLFRELTQIDLQREADVRGATAGMDITTYQGNSVGATLLGIGQDAFNTSVNLGMWS